MCALSLALIVTGIAIAGFWFIVCCPVESDMPCELYAGKHCYSSPLHVTLQRADSEILWRINESISAVDGVCVRVEIR